MSQLETLMKRNREFAAAYDGGSLTIRPRFSTVVLTCLDARVDPAHILGLQLGDAPVLRTAGARVTEGIARDLAIVGALLRQASSGAATRFELAIIAHTDCGMERIADPELRKIMSNATGVDEDVLEGLAIPDHEKAIVEDIDRLRRSKVVPEGLVVSGHLYDVATGTVRQLVGAATVSPEQ